jgi:hypothetical protein
MSPLHDQGRDSGKRGNHHSTLSSRPISENRLAVQRIAPQVWDTRKVPNLGSLKIGTRPLEGGR